jgi:hypothetical protein
MRIFVFLALVLAAADTLALPETLEETGFSEADATAFTPHYPLWSDGSAKRRWLRLPPGTSIDKSNPDAWEFPRGTKAWKEFSRGRPAYRDALHRAPRRRVVALCGLPVERGGHARAARAGGGRARGCDSLARRLPRMPRRRAGADPRL